MRVLLVDDHPLYLEGLRNWLSVHGYDVVGVAGDGLDALVHVRSRQPDIVLMDLEMPGCNGFEATRLIKTEFPRLHIVILTVACDPSTVQEALNCGALDCLPKNINPESLLRYLSQMSEIDQPGQAAKNPARPPLTKPQYAPPLAQLPLAANGKLFGKLSRDTA